MTLRSDGFNILPHEQCGIRSIYINLTVTGTTFLCHFFVAS